MSDREVEVSVQAEGVDDAAGELSGDAVAEGPSVSGAGGGQRRGGLSGALKGGILAALLSQFKSVVNLIDPILTVLNAFLAPIGLIAQRLLQPVLRQWIKLLPLWFDFINLFPTAALSSFVSLAAGLWTTLLSGLLTGILRVAEFVGQFLPSLNDVKGVIPTWSEIQSGLQSLRSRLVSEITSLPGDIGAAVGRRLPDLPSIGGGGGGDGGGLLDRFNPFDRGDSGDGGGGTGPVVNLEGGLDAFVNRITKDPTFDFP
jgi:hypothetical protein